jgi:hypothetical protein
MMDRLMWRVLVPLVLIVFAFQRGEHAALAAPYVPLSLLTALVLQALAILAAALGIFLGRRWTATAGVTFGAAAAATVVLQISVLGIGGLTLAASQILVATLGAAALAWLARREILPAGSRRPDPSLWI